MKTKFIFGSDLADNEVGEAVWVDFLGEAMNHRAWEGAGQDAEEGSFCEEDCRFAVTDFDDYELADFIANVNPLNLVRVTPYLAVGADAFKIEGPLTKSRGVHEALVVGISASDKGSMMPCSPEICNTLATD